MSAADIPHDVSRAWAEMSGVEVAHENVRMWADDVGERCGSARRRARRMVRFWLTKMEAWR